MSTKDRLTEDMKLAMKEKEAGKLRLSVIRMVRASIKYAEIDQHKDLSEDEVLGIVSREVKMRRDSLGEFEKACREDLIAATKDEIAVLLQYLPEQLTEEQLRTVIADAVVKTGASSPKEMGKVMAAIMPHVKGRADGKMVNTIVRELLN